MKDDFGWDFFMDAGGDCVFTPDGDIQVIEGAALVAQDVRGAAVSRLGSLFYAENYGQGLVDMLRGHGSHGDVLRKLKDAALADERVDWATVETGQYSGGQYFLRFGVLGQVDDQVLLFDLAGMDLAGESP